LSCAEHIHCLGNLNRLAHTLDQDRGCAFALTRNDTNDAVLLDLQRDETVIVQVPVEMDPVPSMRVPDI
jgi:hypothetical protein